MLVHAVIDHCWIILYDSRNGCMYMNNFIWETNNGNKYALKKINQWEMNPWSLTQKEQSLYFCSTAHSEEGKWEIFQRKNKKECDIILKKANSSYNTEYKFWK